ncbi:virulence factor SrfC family protein [Methylocapsa acidiphila]|uniref:virulence factor SrfC family protein n=1 Tax=Methylocapsa acidiphila TaxID=133552 RepID=UPI0004124994|nr:virulence factor SrfC family protein [Methylocapsa acidiphila]
MVDTELVNACDGAIVAAKDALAWIAEPKNDPILRQERAFLEHTLRNEAYRLGRLARSLNRPMCVGVFGPSQAGKSYLVSVLGRKGNTLIVLFDDPARPEVDFIREINPYGEKEATGLVTRFSIERPKTPPGFPVALRLLTQTDVLKILCNSYFFDGDLSMEPAVAAEDIERHIAQFDARRTATYVDVLREEDIWDVEDYFQRQLRRAEARVFAPFWPRFAALAPCLSLEDRAELFSILWSRHKPLTALFLDLLRSLEQIDFAEEAFCPLAALVPAATGILNVETLAGLDQSGGETLEVSTCSKTAKLPRPVITALAAELRMTMKEAPWPFFQHTDLLDFPGYRSRDPQNLAKFLEQAKGGALKELFLRGKVDYLFQRYTAEQELTSMLLCIKPSNLEVPTLRVAIEDWVAATHGATPEARRGRPQLLFFVLTMFDQHLSEKVTDPGVDPVVRFQARLDASLLKPFAKVGNAWPLQWTPGVPFQNCFWIRNPNYKSEGVIQYEGDVEIAILPQKVERIAQLREAHNRAPEVLAHFREPARAFDEVMRLNDGGVSYLAVTLEKVCRPGMKEAQARNRLNDLKQRILEALTPHYVPTNLDQRVAERTRVAEAVIADFEECLGRQMFGSFLRGLCVDRGQLTEVFYEARLKGENGEAKPEEAKPAVPARRGGLLDVIKTGAKPQAGVGLTTASARSRHGRNLGYARAALQLWSKILHENCDDPAFADAVGISRESLKETASELIATARRRALEAEIKEAIAEVTHIETTDKAAAKATIVAERHINRFVMSLGTAAAPRETAFDAAGFGARPAEFQQEFVLGWVRGFYEQALANAQSSDGLIHDAEQNARLGDILACLNIGS